MEAFYQALVDDQAYIRGRRKVLKQRQGVSPRDPYVAPLDCSIQKSFSQSTGTRSKLNGFFDESQSDGDQVPSFEFVSRFDKAAAIKEHEAPRTTLCLYSMGCQYDEKIYIHAHLW